MHSVIVRADVTRLELVQSRRAASFARASGTPAPPNGEEREPGVGGLKRRLNRSWARAGALSRPAESGPAARSAAERT